MNELTRADLGNLINEMNIKVDMTYAALVEKALAVNSYFQYPLPEIAVRRNFTTEGLATIFLVQEGIDFEIEAHANAVAELNEAYGIYADAKGKLEMLKCLRDDFVWVIK